MQDAGLDRAHGSSEPLHASADRTYSPQFLQSLSLSPGYIHAPITYPSFIPQNKLRSVHYINIASHNLLPGVVNPALHTSYACIDGSEWSCVVITTLLRKHCRLQAFDPNALCLMVNAWIIRDLPSKPGVADLVITGTPLLNVA